MNSSFFTQFGLTDNEESIYLFLLSHGSSLASMISKRLKIKRVTVYASLESLLKKELVNSLQKNKVKYFSAVAPGRIVEICESKTGAQMALQKEATRLVPHLEKIQKMQHEPILEVQGRISYYQGLDAVKKLIDETLEEESDEQLCFGLNDYHIKHLAHEWKEYTKKRISKKMHVQSIQPDTKHAKAYKKRDMSELRTTYLVPRKKFPANCELNIIGDMIAIFTTHGDEPTGTKIYNKDMAEVLRSLFKLAWEKAKGYDE